MFKLYLLHTLFIPLVHNHMLNLCILIPLFFKKEEIRSEYMNSCGGGSHSIKAIFYILLLILNSPPPLNGNIGILCREKIKT